MKRPRGEGQHRVAVRPDHLGVGNPGRVVAQAFGLFDDLQPLELGVALLGDGSIVVYKHAIPGRKQTAVSIDANCHYHTKGAGVVEVSADGETWLPLARFEGVQRIQAQDQLQIERHDEEGPHEDEVLCEQADQP